MRRRRALRALYARRAELAAAIRLHGDPFNPTVGEQHTRGMYDGINHAIGLLEGER